MYYTKRGLQAVCFWVLCDAAVRGKKNFLRDLIIMELKFFKRP